MYFTEYKVDQNSSDIAAFKFYDSEFAARADYVAMTLDATGTGGKSFVKLFAESNVQFNVSIYIPGIEGVSKSVTYCTVNCIDYS